MVDSKSRNGRLFSSTVHRKLDIHPTLYTFFTFIKCIIIHVKNVYEECDIMRHRKKLKPQDAIKKDHYRSILWLIHLFEHKKIKFYHLRYALVEQHGINLSEKTTKALHDFFEDDPNKLQHSEWYQNKIIGKRGINNLTNFLKKLSKLLMIEKYKDKGDRFPAYRLTKLGERVFRRWYVHYLIDEFIPDEGLSPLLMKVGEVIAKVGIRYE